MPEPNITNETKGPKSETDLYKDQWMFRPCSMYKEEYNDCKCIQARFHQYFIYGEYIDCTQWKIDYDNCYLWQKYKNKEAYDALLTSEKERRMQRLRGHFENDVWEKRDKPPENWNAPLPDWLEKKSRTSYLNIAKDKLKVELEKDEAYHIKSSSCILM